MRVTLPKPQPLLFSIFCGFEIIDRLILFDAATPKKYDDDNDDSDGEDIGDTNDNDVTMMVTVRIMVIQMMM